MMEKVLFIAHTGADGALPQAALETLSAALALGGEEFCVGLVGEDVQGAAASISDVQLSRAFSSALKNKDKKDK